MTQGAQLAEGGFSFVYVATDARGRRRALKRIRCQSTEQIKAAQWELTVHRELTASGHPNLLPLADWGMRAEPRGEHFYFLTPLARRGSLRDEINRRVLAGSAPSWCKASVSLEEKFKLIYLMGSHMVWRLGPPSLMFSESRRHFFSG